MDKSIIKNLLVPLDGSALAESVLPVALQLAKKINVSITFIHMIESDAPKTIHGQRHLTNPEQAEQYLHSIASSELFKGITVDIHVHDISIKSVSQSISEHSKELNQDLVIMCTHGSGGLHDLLFGSIAQQVISLGNIPVLLVNPSQKKINAFEKFENFLIPLDGNPEHEHVLEYSTLLAKLCNAKIHLLIAVPHFGTMSGKLTAANRLLPGTTTKMMDMIVSDAEEYLANLKKRLEASGLKVSVSTSRNDPADAIAETVKIVNADLIILGTHGKKGADAFWEGSVTPKISRSSEIPLLLVPVKG
ncbi:MAG: universal stress protein [Ignavibacteriaceae bacterium]|nr:universal stress protein [Ignavibacteriaceae bacterium]